VRYAARVRRLGTAWACFVFASCGCAGCAEPRAAGVEDTAAAPNAATPRARAWPEADALFRRDPRWLGGDAAVSIALDGERVLWLFGDTFTTEAVPAALAAPPPRTRAGARFVRNSVGVQHGLDPISAQIEFAIGHARDGGAASFFADEAGAWFWPGSGAYLDGTLIVFLERMREDRAPGGLGFRSAGWTAVRVRDPRAPPSEWQLERIATPDTGELGAVGVAVVVEGAFVYAYAVREPGDHAVTLLRWPRAAFARGELLAPEYFGGAQRGFGPPPGAIVVADGATEFSVTRSAPGRYLLVQSRGFGAAPIALRFAAALGGPWSASRDVFRPDEAARPNALVYAARAHPEQDAGGDLALTYASNTLDAGALLDDLSLYFPRFVRVTLDRRP
jgi:hypothetical protein